MYQTAGHTAFMQAKKSYFPSNDMEKVLHLRLFLIRHMGHIASEYHLVRMINTIFMCLKSEGQIDPKRVLNSMIHRVVFEIDLLQGRSKGAVYENSREKQNEIEMLFHRFFDAVITGVNGIKKNPVKGLETFFQQTGLRFEADVPTYDYRFLNKKPRYCSVLHNLSLHNANLSKINLLNSDCSHSNFMWANFSNSRLCRSHFEFSNLQHANFDGADLSHADFRHADMRNAYFGRHYNAHKCLFENAVFDDNQQIFDMILLFLSGACFGKTKNKDILLWFLTTTNDCALGWYALACRPKECSKYYFKCYLNEIPENDILDDDEIEQCEQEAEECAKKMLIYNKQSLFTLYNLEDFFLAVLKCIDRIPPKDRKPAFQILKQQTISSSVSLDNSAILAMFAKHESSL